MAHILLLHSALGLRPAVLEFAELLRADGHSVHAPDYYERNVFDEESAGIAYRDSVGIPTLMARARAELDRCPPETVLAGFSLGAFFAQAFAGKRPHAQAAILLHSVAPPRGEWNGVPVQVHRYAHDSWIKPADVEALGACVRSSGATFDDFVTPGSGHLFTDLHGPDGDETARDTAISRIRATLA